MAIVLDGYTAIEIYKAIGFPLNSDGTFDVPTESEDLYEGIEFLAPTGFEFNLGSPRGIPVVSQGQVKTTFNLPSIEAKTATLRASFEKLSVDASLTNTKISTINNIKVLGVDTDKSGQEKTIAFAISQLQAHDDSSNLMWVNMMLNRTRISPNRPILGTEHLVKEYAMTVSRSKKALWGETYTESTHGYTQAAANVLLSERKLGFGVWKGDGAITEFLLPADKPAYTSATAKVWDLATGAARAGTWDENTNATTFTPTVTLADGAMLFVTYEY